jgi:hypothetical protein
MAASMTQGAGAFTHSIRSSLLSASGAGLLSLIPMVTFLSESIPSLRFGTERSALGKSSQPLLIART